MANFLITSPNSLTTGTDTTDLFILNTALGSTVYGNGGADTISSVATNLTNAQIFGGPGGDTVFLTAGSVNGSVAGIFLGNGADVLVASATNVPGITNSTIIGGGGNDTINLIGTYTDTNINGNQGSDLITASGASFTRGFVAGGGDADTIVLNALGASTTSTVNGGGGADVLTISGAGFSTGRIDADTLNDSQFFGNDTVTLNTTLTGSFVQLGGGADRLTQNGVVGTGATIEGGAGLDSISLGSLAAASSTVFVGGGAGVDTIAVSAALGDNFGTIQGGGGADVINVSGAGASAGAIMGGAAGDLIGLGTITQKWGTGAAVTNGVSGVFVSYQSLDQSSVTDLDVISARTLDGNGASTGGVFMVTQSAVNFAAVANGNYGGSDLTVGTGNRVTNFSAGITTLTQRVAALNSGITAVGSTVVFQAGNTNYLFIQGGTTDLVAQLNVGGFTLSGTTNVVNGGISIANNSAIKINFTDNAVF
jgi:hypothetical protein